MSSEPSSSHVSRRQSIGKAFDKIRDALTGRRSSLKGESSSSSAIANLPPAVIPEILEADESPETAETKPLGESFVHIQREFTQNDRARLLCDKYGLDYEEMGAKFFPDAPREGVLRVEKPIRMRVRYACHSCSSLFLKSSTCAKCSHERCRECPRIPPKKKKKRTQKSEEKKEE